MTFESVEWEHEEDEGGVGVAMPKLHRATRIALKGLIAEQRRELGIAQRYIDHADKRPNNDGLDQFKNEAKRLRIVIGDLEQLLKRGRR